jgi:hypothetical protein
MPTTPSSRRMPCPSTRRRHLRPAQQRGHGTRRSRQRQDRYGDRAKDTFKEWKCADLRLTVPATFATSGHQHIDASISGSLGCLHVRDLCRCHDSGIPGSPGPGPVVTEADRDENGLSSQCGIEQPRLARQCPGQEAEAETKPGLPRVFSLLLQERHRPRAAYSNHSQPAGSGYCACQHSSGDPTHRGIEDRCAKSHRS